MYFKPDEDIMEAANLFAINDKAEKDLNEMLEHYKRNCKAGPIPNYEFSIPLKEKKIINSKAYPVPLKYKEKFKEEIRRLVKDGVLRRSESKFSTPCFATEKSNGDLRILADFRKLNQLSEPFDELFPNIHEEFYKFNKCKIFSTMDMKSGYYHVKIKENDIHKTAIITEFGKYEYCRVAFGLMNAPKFFHSMMRNLLENVKDAHVYVDDIIIASQTYEEHLIVI
jgi:hypothetical protein